MASIPGECRAEPESRNFVGRAMLRLRLFTIVGLTAVTLTGVAHAQSLPKIRVAYTSIGIQFDPVYIMKELDLPRKYGADSEILFVPATSRALQAALARDTPLMTSGGVANIKPNVN